MSQNKFVNPTHRLVLGVLLHPLSVHAWLILAASCISDLKTSDCCFADKHFIGFLTLCLTSLLAAGSVGRLYWPNNCPVYQVLLAFISYMATINQLMAGEYREGWRLNEKRVPKENREGTCRVEELNALRSRSSNPINKIHSHRFFPDNPIYYPAQDKDTFRFIKSLACITSTKYVW